MLAIMRDILQSRYLRSKRCAQTISVNVLKSQRWPFQLVFCRDLGKSFYCFCAFITSIQGLFSSFICSHQVTFYNAVVETMSIFDLGCRASIILALLGWIRGLIIFLALCSSFAFIQDRKKSPKNWSKAILYGLKHFVIDFGSSEDIVLVCRSLFIRKKIVLK